MGVFFLFSHMEKWEYRMMFLILIFMSSPQFGALQHTEENHFPTDNKDTEQTLLHDITLALKSLVLCLCRTETEAGASGIHLAVPIITHDSGCSSAWQPHLGGPGVKTIRR